MGTLLIISAISVGGVVFLSYFGYSIWRDTRRQPEKRVRILQLRETIAQKRHQPRVLYMRKLDTIQQPAGERARKI